MLGKGTSPVIPQTSINEASRTSHMRINNKVMRCKLFSSGQIKRNNLTATSLEWWSVGVTIPKGALFQLGEELQFLQLPSFDGLIPMYEYIYIYLFIYLFYLYLYIPMFVGSTDGWLDPPYTLQSNSPLINDFPIIQNNLHWVRGFPSQPHGWLPEGKSMNILLLSLLSHWYPCIKPHKPY